MEKTHQIALPSSNLHSLKHANMQCRRPKGLMGKIFTRNNPHEVSAIGLNDESPDDRNARGDSHAGNEHNTPVSREEVLSFDIMPCPFVHMSGCKLVPRDEVGFGRALSTKHSLKPKTCRNSEDNSTHKKKINGSPDSEPALKSYSQLYAEGSFNLSKPPAPLVPITGAVPFLQAPHPPNEIARLAAVRSSTVCDHFLANPGRCSLLEETIHKFGVHAAMVSTVDSQWETFHMTSGHIESPRCLRRESFGGHVILSDDCMVILDTELDWRFAGNPQVTQHADSAIRFYAGTPLISSDGYAIGVLAIASSCPRDSFSSKQRRQLSIFAERLMNEVEMEANGAHSIEKFIPAQVDGTVESIAGSGSDPAQIDRSIQSQVIHKRAPKTKAPLQRLVINNFAISRHAFQAEHSPPATDDSGTEVAVRPKSVRSTSRKTQIYRKEQHVAPGEIQNTPLTPVSPVSFDNSQRLAPDAKWSANDWKKSFTAPTSSHDHCPSPEDMITTESAKARIQELLDIKEVSKSSPIKSPGAKEATKLITNKNDLVDFKIQDDCKTDSQIEDWINKQSIICGYSPWQFSNRPKPRNPGLSDASAFTKERSSSECPSPEDHAVVFNSIRDKGAEAVKELTPLLSDCSTFERKYPYNLSEQGISGLISDVGMAGHGYGACASEAASDECLINHELFVNDQLASDLVPASPKKEFLLKAKRLGSPQLIGKFDIRNILEGGDHSTVYFPRPAALPSRFRSLGAFPLEEATQSLLSNSTFDDSFLSGWSGSAAPDADVDSLSSPSQNLPIWRPLETLRISCRKVEDPVGKGIEQEAESGNLSRFIVLQPSADSHKSFSPNLSSEIRFAMELAAARLAVDSLYVVELVSLRPSMSNAKDNGKGVMSYSILASLNVTMDAGINLNLHLNACRSSQVKFWYDNECAAGDPHEGFLMKLNNKKDPRYATDPKGGLLFCAFRHADVNGVLPSRLRKRDMQRFMETGRVLRDIIFKKPSDELGATHEVTNKGSAFSSAAPHNIPRKRHIPIEVGPIF